MTFVRAQGDMRFFGTATKGGKPLSGALVNVYMDGKLIINLTTGKNGKFRFTVDIGHTYRINFSSPGCVDMYMTMDLKVPPEKAWIYPDYVAEIPFFEPNDPKIKTDLFAKKPFIKVIFDGTQGFYDDPSYRFIDEVFKDPLEEQKILLAKKEAEERTRKEAEEKAKKEEEERLRLEREAELKRKAEEELKKNQQKDNEAQQPTMESDAIKLEKEKQEKLEQEKQNRNIRNQYENNLLKMVAESERKTNLQKYNKMKEDADANSVVQVMRLEAQRKAQSDYLMEQQKERMRQELANKQVKSEKLNRLIQTVAQLERTEKAGKLRPVVKAGPLNYIPSPHIITTTEDGFFSDVITTIIWWPGGKHIAFKKVIYWWGTYYYKEEKEITEKIYNEERSAYRRS
ncbi:MAG: hypothetical protein Fur0041_02900 [Bacteroidia bacterium]